MVRLVCFEKQETVMKMMKWHGVALLILLSGCTSLGNDSGSAAEMRPARQQANPEARFQRYGPFIFVGKYRISHEWVHGDPRGIHYCHGYDSVREDVVDELGEKRPARMGMDMREEAGMLVQRAPYFKPDATSDKTRFVIGKYRPKAPGGPRYEHEKMCRTYFEPLANEYELWLKKTSLDAMRAQDRDDVAKRWKYARLIKPINYEAIRFANLPAQRVVWTYTFAPKGMEDSPTRLVTEEIRVPIGETGYVYQLAFTLSDVIVQNEPEKATRRRGYWQRIQDSFRIDPIR